MLLTDVISFVRARLDEIAFNQDDMIGASQDDRNLETTIRQLLPEAVKVVVLSAPVHLLEPDARYVVSTGTINPSEKAELSQLKIDIVAEYSGIIDKADSFHISTTAYRGAYMAAITALDKYTAPSPENIVVEPDYENIATYYTARTALLQAIYDEAFRIATNDHSVNAYFYYDAPALDAPPSNEWTTDDQKDRHVGDLYYDYSAEYAYRFTRFQAQLSYTYLWAQVYNQTTIDELDAAHHAKLDAEQAAADEETKKADLASWANDGATIPSAFQSVIMQDGVITVVVGITNYCRLVSFQANDSGIPVTKETPFESPEARMQLNPYTRGTADAPVLVRRNIYETSEIVGLEQRIELKYYTSSECAFAMSVVKEPAITGNGTTGLPYTIFCPRPLKEAVLNQLVGKVLETYNDQRAQSFYQKSNSYLTNGSI